VPGGVSEPLTMEKRDAMLKLLPEGLDIAKRTYAFFKTLVPKFKDEAHHFGSLPTMFLSLVTPKGNLEHYDGLLRVKDAQGRILEDMVPPHEYERLIGEAVEDFSYMKFPYYKPHGLPQRHLSCRTACASQQRGGLRHAVCRRRTGRVPYMLQESGPITSSFHYHYARLVEIIYALEMMDRLLKDPSILDARVRARARSNRDEGIGVAEAPAGS
jgi:NAD-reducing hydrogenase large subunit